MADFKTTIFRLQNGNDVRGAAIATDTEKRTLTPGIVEMIAAAFAKELEETTGKSGKELRIGVGHDSRVTAEEIAKACFRGLSHVQSYDCGLVTTPAMFQSTILPASDFDGAIMLTASHLPFNRNGMKFFTKEGSPDKKKLAAVLEKAAALAEKWGTEDEKELIVSNLPAGDISAEPFDMVSVYCEHMKQLIIDGVGRGDKPLAGLHIVEDAGNGAAGFFAEKILEPLGADISGSVFLDPDGMFPNHIPNPENKAAMDAVRSAVVSSGADLGVIFDCDGDRGAAVFADGTEVNRNTLIALLSTIVAEEAPGSTVVTDSVTSDELGVFLEDKLGISHLRFKRGYKNVIDKGIELNEAGTRCELAIETSGHGAFRENHFSDDGAYICVKIIIKMAALLAEGRRIEELIADLEQPAEAEEIRFKITEEDFRSYGEKVLADFRAFAESRENFRIVEPNYEGIRVSFDDEKVKGWVLVRMSLHDPVIPVNLESARAGGLSEIHSRLDPFFAGYAGLVK